MFIMKKNEPPSSCIDSKIQSGPQDAVYSQVQSRQLLVQSNVARCQNEECLFSISKLSFHLHCKHKKKQEYNYVYLNKLVGKWADA